MIMGWAHLRLWNILNHGQMSLKYHKLVWRHRKWHEHLAWLKECRFWHGYLAEPYMSVTVCIHVSCVWLCLFLFTKYKRFLLCFPVHTLDHHTLWHTYGRVPGMGGRSLRLKEIAHVSRGNAGNRRISSNDWEDAFLMRSISLKTYWKIFVSQIDFPKQTVSLS